VRLGRLWRSLNRPLERLDGLLSVSGGERLQAFADFYRRLRILRLGCLDRLLHSRVDRKLLGSSLLVSAAREQSAQVVVNGRVRGIKLHGSPHFLRGAVRIAGPCQGQSQPVVEFRIFWLELCGFPELAGGLPRIGLDQVDQPQVVAGIREVRLQPQRHAKFVRRVVEVALFGEGDAEVVMRLCEAGPKRERLPEFGDLRRDADRPF